MNDLLVNAYQHFPLLIAHSDPSHFQRKNDLAGGQKRREGKKKKRRNQKDEEEVKLLLKGVKKMEKKKNKKKRCISCIIGESGQI